MYISNMLSISIYQSILFFCAVMPGCEDPRQAVGRRVPHGRGLRDGGVGAAERRWQARRRPGRRLAGGPADAASQQGGPRRRHQSALRGDLQPRKTAAGLQQGTACHRSLLFKMSSKHHHILTIKPFPWKIWTLRGSDAGVQQGSILPPENLSRTS